MGVAGIFSLGSCTGMSPGDTAVPALEATSLACFLVVSAAIASSTTSSKLLRRFALWFLRNAARTIFHLLLFRPEFFSIDGPWSSMGTCMILLLPELCLLIIFWRRVNLPRALVALSMSPSLSLPPSPFLQSAARPPPSVSFSLSL